MFSSDQKRSKEDFPVSELRRVTIRWKNSGGFTPEKSEFLVHESEVDLFVKACLELHDNPGVNPYSNRKTQEAEMIYVQCPHTTGPYWWSTPGLHDNRDEKGATVVEFLPTDPVWQSDNQ